MIDVHAHFAEEGYDFPQEWDSILSCGVRKVILAGDTLLHSRMHRDFCAQYEGAYFCAGAHPTEKKQPFNEQERQELLLLLQDKKCVALGEIGLDYHYPDTNKVLQRDLFCTQLCMAAEAGLPVQVHSRDAAADTLAILREMKDYLKHGFLLHCYSYARELMDDFLELGAYFSFGGVTCFKNAKKVVESVFYCPEDKILTETDSPYLSPFRGEKNSPKNIPTILNKISEIKNIPFFELENKIEENAERLFFKLK